MSYNLDGYIDVASRIKLFIKKYPDGSLQMDPPEWVTIDGKQWVIGRAHAYRTPDDPRPGIGTAWEIVPGTTNFTRGSEIQNLETSAFGRAIGALGIGIDASIATLDEIQHAKERGKVTRTTEALPDDPWITEAPAPAYDGGVPGKGSSMYPLTGPQLKAIHAILAKRDIRDDLDKLANVNAWLTGLNKTAVTSITEMNKTDASGYIDHLQKGVP